MHLKQPNDRIAVIGAGIAGLSTAWLLAPRYRVTLFEAEDYLGGHTHTVDVTLDGISHPVDTGFLVFNDRTYPNLNGLFDHLGVQHAESDMSFSVSLPEQNVEWAGTNLSSVFADRRNLIRPAFLAMLNGIRRFNRDATRLVLEERIPDCSLGDYLRERRYGDEFQTWYLIPMIASIWSTPSGAMLNFPLSTLLRFCHNHGLLSISNRPRWRTVAGGGREYVKRIAQSLLDIRLGQRVLSIKRTAEDVQIATNDGMEKFDHAVLACHPEQSLQALSAASSEETTILSAIRYHHNRVILHTDSRFLPTRSRAWAAWNYRADGPSKDHQSVCVTYLINRLQPLPFKRPVMVTMNPGSMPSPQSTLGEFRYAHPIFDRAATAAQAALAQIQGVNRTWFCGAWTRYGFHEDGLMSALTIANQFGIRAPWQTAP